MQVLLFGMVAEVVGSGRMELEASSTLALRSELVRRFPGLKELDWSIAVDRRIEHEDHQLTGAEEIAVLPPFAGG